MIISSTDVGGGERCKAIGTVQLCSWDPHHKVGAGGEKWSHIILSSSSGLIDWLIDWQQDLKNSTWNGRLGKLHDDVMMIVW